jgi:hypothetical protein
MIDGVVEIIYIYIYIRVEVQLYPFFDFGARGG